MISTNEDEIPRDGRRVAVLVEKMNVHDQVVVIEMIVIRQYMIVCVQAMATAEITIAQEIAVASGLHNRVK